MARVLVVDDDLEMRRTLTSALSSHSVFQAANGTEALRLLKSEPIDLVVTDLVMPGMDGIETIVALRKTFPKLKVIAVSGAADRIRESALSAAEQLGINGTLAKPFMPEELITLVDQVLGQKAS